MEIFGFVSGLLYLILEIKQNKWMWLVNFITAVLYAIIFAQSKLYAAMGLQIYYVLISIYGFIIWQKDKISHADGSRSGDVLLDTESDKGAGDGIYYRTPNFKVLIFSAVSFAAIFVAMLTFLRNMTGDPMPVADAFTTSLSIIATFWLGRAIIHQWILWIVVDIISVGMFFSQGLYPTALLYLIYTFSAIYGYIHWKRKGALL